MAGRPICPQCGADGVPLLYGLPHPVAIKAARAGAVALAGCVVRGEDPDWQCSGPERHWWRHDDEAVWTAAVDAALADGAGDAAQS